MPLTDKIEEQRILPEGGAAGFDRRVWEVEYKVSG
jgi:hypothetical protein